MQRILAVLAISVSFVGRISAQQTELPVGDLLRPARLAHSKPEKNPLRDRWITRQKPANFEATRVQGEGTLLRALGVQPWFTPDDLVSVVKALGTPSEVTVEGTNLVVDADGAASALQALERLRRALPPRVLLDVKVERLGKSEPQTLFQTRQYVRAGSTVAFHDAVGHLEIRDFDVEIAQASVTANPIVGTLEFGTCIAVRPRVVPGRDELLLEVFTRVAAEASAPGIEAAKDGMFPIDRAARALSEAGVALRVPRGASRSVRFTAANGDELRLTCAASGGRARTAPNRDPLVRCHGLFRSGIAEFRTDVPEPDRSPVGFATEAAFRRAGGKAVDLITGEGAADVVVIRGANAQAVDQAIAARLSRQLAAADLEILVYDAKSGADPRAGTDRPLVHIRSPVIVGRSVAFSGRTELRFVRDWDVEVAQSARIPDPKVDVLRHGYHVDARVLAGTSGVVEAVAVEARVSHLQRIDTKRAKISRKISAGAVPSENGTLSPAIVLPADIVLIESPVVQHQSVDAVLPLDEKRTAILRRAAPRLFGQGRDLVIVVRIEK